MSDKNESKQQLTIFGATGFVGKVLTEKALQKGHAVRTLARSPEKLGDLLPKVECIKGDYFNPESIQEALQGSTAVISAIGPPLGLGRGAFVGKYPVAMQQLIAAMQAQQIKRIITIAGASVPIGDAELPTNAKLIRVVMNLIGGKISRDKDTEAKILSESDLEWIILRPPGIKKNRRGELIASEFKLAGSFVDLDQVADFMLSNVSDQQWVKKAPFLATK